QITKDQSLMQKLIEAGEITEEEAEMSERRNIILQALGPEAQIKVDLTHQQVRQNDVLIICSDGLSGQVKTEEIASAATEEPDLMSVCKRLIARANENGGPDNITVIAARFEGSGLVPPETGDSVGHRVFPLPTDSGQTTAARITLTGGINTTKETLATPRRPTRKIPQPEPAFALLPPEVSATRRLRGSLIALALVVVFLALATWWTYRAASAVVAPQQRSTPGQTPTP
ncbi:MAG: PP2C family serine/threonine-protein phosphatase, partial [bacterium]